jgi:predicted enzyme related to lactoylglutathione lyase
VVERVTFSVDVPDLRAGIEFYTEGLGFEAEGRASEDAFHLEADNVRIDLLEREPGSPSFPGASTGRSYRRHWTPVHLDLEVADVASAVRKAREAGATVESGPEKIGEELIAGCADPFGNGFCLVQPLED